MLLSQKKTERKRDVGEPPLESFTRLPDMRAAIAAVLFEEPGRLDIRHLWTRGRMNYFRVNWWVTEARGVSRITHSSFIQLEAIASGWRIHRRTDGRGGAPPEALKERQAA